MKNEPQLSAEMEKRFDDRFPKNKFGARINIYYSEHPITGETQYLECSGQVKHFLATALEEQKQGYEKWANEKIAKCERLKESNFVNESPDYFRGKIAILNDLLAILNGKEANE